MKGLLVHAARVAAFCAFCLALSACGSSSIGRSLLQVDVFGDQIFDHVTLRISTDVDSAQRVYSQATFDTLVPYQVGIYVVPGLTETVRLTATVDNGACIQGRGTIDVQGVTPGAIKQAVSLRVLHTPTCEPFPDGGVTGAGGSGVGGAPGAGGAGAGTGGTGAGGRGTGGAGAGTGGSPGTGGRGTGGAGPGTGGSPGTGGGAANDPDLVLWYPFDEADGSVAADASGFAGGPRNGQVMVVGLTTGAVFSATHMVGTHALDLTGGTTTNGGWVELPSLVELAPDAMTIAVWVYVKAAFNFQKVFSFGTSAGIYMSLTTNSNRPAGVEFEITMTGDTATAQIAGGTGVLPAGAWHHLAVVLPAGNPYTGSLYIDGALKSTNTFTLRPSSLGTTTTQNYLGKSAIGSTAYADMILDDFRVYRRALTAAEITDIYGLR